MKELRLLFAFSFLVFIFTLYKTINWPEAKNILVRIEANEKDITSLDDQRFPKLVSTQFFKSIDFPSSDILRHRSGRPLGIHKNFFLNLQSNFELISDKNVELLIRSDDGYRLFIDDKLVSEFTKDRPAKEDIHTILLKSGHHKLSLDYFQGFGNAALEVKYKLSTNSRYIPFGISSKDMKFFSFD